MAINATEELTSSEILNSLRIAGIDGVVLLSKGDKLCRALPLGRICVTKDVASRR
jgi:hypothetical protein